MTSVSPENSSSSDMGVVGAPAPYARPVVGEVVDATTRFSETLFALLELSRATDDLAPSRRVMDFFERTLDLFTDTPQGAELVAQWRKTYTIIPANILRQIPEAQGWIATDEASQDLRKIFETASEPKHDQHIHLHRMRLVPAPSGLVLQGVVLVAVATLESLVSEVVRWFFSAQPSRARDVTFTLEQLTEIGDIEAARAAAAETKVDGVMSSVEHWQKWLEDPSQLNTKLGSFSYDSDGFNEIMQRRHAHVHAGGRVSRRYLQKVGSSLAVGDELKIDRPYAEAAIEQLLCVGQRISVAAARKLQLVSEDVAAAMLLYAVMHDLPNERLWQATVELCKAVAASDARVAFRMEAKVHGWWARIRVGDASALSEVEAWDVSALSTRWQVARSLLLDAPNAKAEAEKAFATGSIAGQLRDIAFFGAYLGGKTKEQGPSACDGSHGGVDASEDRQPEG